MRTPEEIGKIVRRLRGNLSLRDFATKCGVSHSTIDYIEKGYDFRTGKPTFPSAAVLSKIAAAANVSLDYIVGVNKSEENTIPTAELTLSDGERMIIDLFRQIPVESQESAIEMLRSALKVAGILE